MKLTKNDILICLLIVISTLAVYARVLHYDFVNFDDNEYVYDNEFVKNGITPESIVWAFTHSHAANWHPLTWISHMLDCQFFGMNAGRHHFINLIFHLLNSLLVYVIFRKMTGKLWQSCFVAGVFALHPLHVESVAWISERKDVLSTFFGLIAVLNYIGYVLKKKVYKFFGFILFFSFGLMSKSMLVTLPFVLLLLDYWPLQRLPFQNTSSFQLRDHSSFLNLLLEKMPLFILSFITCLITLLTQKTGAAIRSFDQVPFGERVANALVSYVSYIYKSIYPITLSCLYPYNGMPVWWEIAGSFFLIGLISFISIRAIKSHPYLFVGWFWFLGTLIPVIGLVQVGSQSMADRYMYIPLIGLTIIIAWGIPDSLSNGRYKKIFLSTISFCILCIFFILTRQQVTYWKDGLTLSRHAVNVTTDNGVMENNLANMLVRRGQFSKSIAHYIEALRIKPDDTMTYDNLMKVLNKITKDRFVAKNMVSVITLYPKSPALYYTVAKMFRDENNVDMAIKYLKKSLKLDKHFIPAYYELSMLYLSTNEFDRSFRLLKKLLELQPGSPKPYIYINRLSQLLENEYQNIP